MLDKLICLLSLNQQHPHTSAELWPSSWQRMQDILEHSTQKPCSTCRQRCERVKEVCSPDIALLSCFPVRATCPLPATSRTPKAGKGSGDDATAVADHADAAQAWRRAALHHAPLRPSYATSQFFVGCLYSNSHPNAPLPPTHSAAHVQVWHAVVEALGVGSGHGAGQVSEASVSTPHLHVTNLNPPPPEATTWQSGCRASAQTRRARSSAAASCYSSFSSARRSSRK